MTHFELWFSQGPQSNLNSDQYNLVMCISNHTTLLKTIHWVPPRLKTKVLQVIYQASTLRENDQTVAIALK